MIFNLCVQVISLLVWSFLKLSKLISVASFVFFWASFHDNFCDLIKCFFLVVFFLVLEKFHLVYEPVPTYRLNLLGSPFQSFFHVFAKVLVGSSPSIILVLKVKLIDVLGKVELDHLLRTNFRALLLVLFIHVLLLFIRIHILIRVNHLNQ